MWFSDFTDLSINFTDADIVKLVSWVVKNWKSLLVVDIGEKSSVVLDIGLYFITV